MQGGFLKYMTPILCVFLSTAFAGAGDCDRKTIFPQLPYDMCLNVVQKCDYSGQMRLFLTSKAGLPWIMWWKLEHYKRQDLFINYFRELPLGDIPFCFPRSVWAYHECLRDNKHPIHQQLKINNLSTGALWIKTQFKAPDMPFELNPVALMYTRFINDRLIEEVIKEHNPPAVIIDSSMLTFDQQGEPDPFKAQREQEASDTNGFSLEAIVIGVYMMIYFS